MGTFAEFLEDRGRQPSTVQKYLEIVKSYGKGKLRIDGISSIRKTQILAALRAYAKFCPKEKRKVEAFCQRITVARREATMPEMPLTTEEWQKLLSRIENSCEPYRAVLKTLLRTPLRVGDVGRIKREWIERARKEKKLLLQPKGGKYRLLPWSVFRSTLEPLLAEFPKWRSEERIWQISWRAEESFRQAMARHLKDAAIACKILDKRVHLHLLRHTVAQQIADLDGTKSAQEMLGHTDEKTTRQYLVPSRKTEDIFTRLDEERMEKTNDHT